MKNFKLYLAITVLFLIIGTSIFAPCLAIYNPFEPNMAERLMEPCANHFFGTDNLGRDMFSRVLYGGRASMVLSLLAAVLSLMIGMVIGVVSGFYGGKFDAIITIITNIFQGIPSSCFMIAIVGVLGVGIESLVFALVVTSWAGFSRIVRAQVLELKEESFMEGLYAIGCSDWRLITRHIVPNIFNKLLVLFTIRLGRGILSIAGLSFIGLGIQPPTPDWSVMINDAMLYYRSSPHLIIIPGLFIFLLIYSINTLGDEMRDRLDVQFSEVRKW